MKSLLLLPLLLLAAPDRAEASGCWLGPYTTTADPRLGCEVVVYEPVNNPLDTTKLTAYRGNQQVTLTASVTTATTSLEVLYGNYECDGTVIQEYTQTEDYKLHRITLSDAQVGDQLWLDAFFVGTIQPQGTCTEAMAPKPTCTSTNSGYGCYLDDGGGLVGDALTGNDAGAAGGNDDRSYFGKGGCSASSTSSPAWLALALLILGHRRRRRS